jgi:signal transduction histidine kinase
MTRSTEWLRQRHRRVMRGLRIFFGVQIAFSVGLAFILDLVERQPFHWLALISGGLVGLLLLPRARRILRWMYIPILLGVDMLHVTALLWAAPATTLARGSLWALAYIPVLVAAGRWWSYPGGAVALSVVLATDAAVLFGRLPWRAAGPVFVFQAVTAALGTWAAAQSESRTRRDLLHQEALHLSEEQVLSTTRAYQELASGLQQIHATLAVATAALPGDIAQTQAQLSAASDGVQATTVRLNRTLRDIGGLPLAGRTLPEALAAELRQLRLETHVDSQFSCDGHLPATRPVVTAFLWRVVQETLSNVRKHAQAHKVKVDLYGQQGCVVLSIHDDGVGFDAAELSNGAGPVSLARLQIQAAEFAGSLEVESRPAGGTLVAVRVPAANPRS